MFRGCYSFAVIRTAGEAVDGAGPPLIAESHPPAGGLLRLREPQPSTVEMLQPGPNSGVCLLLAPLKYADECQECVMSAIRPKLTCQRSDGISVVEG